MKRSPLRGLPLPLPLPPCLSLSLSLSLERGLVPLRESLGSVRRACNLSYSLAVDTDGIKHGVCIQCPTKVLVSLGFREDFFFFLEGRRREKEIGSMADDVWYKQKFTIYLFAERFFERFRI